VNVKRIRTYLDYLLYVIHIRLLDFSRLIIEFALFIILLITSMSMLAKFNSAELSGQNMALILALFYLTFRIIWHLTKLVSGFFSFLNVQSKLRFQECNFIRRKVGEFTVERIEPDGKDDNNGFAKLDIIIDGVPVPIFRSKSINNHLWSNKQYKMNKFNKRKWEVRKRISKNSKIYLEILKLNVSTALGRNEHFINQSKLCLASDLELDETNIRCHKGGYFDSVLTNDLCKHLYFTEHKGEENIFYDGSFLFPLNIQSSSHISLKPISQTKLNNHIGVSTLAFTQDNYMIIWRQSADSHVDHLRFVASGDGSADWSDLKKRDLCSALKYSMERELREECLNLKNAKLKTMITGYFRWVEKAGKPQFTGITKINNRKYEDISPLEGTMPHDSLPFVTLLRKKEDLIPMIETILASENLSVSLAASLIFLKDLIMLNPKEIEEFIFCN
jgi:hypothetical protein